MKEIKVGFVLYSRVALTRYMYFEGCAYPCTRRDQITALLSSLHASYSCSQRFTIKLATEGGFRDIYIFKCSSRVGKNVALPSAPLDGMPCSFILAWHM